MADKSLVTLTAGQRVVDLTFSYTPDTDILIVSLNGQALIKNMDYTELSPTQIALIDPGTAGEIVEARTLEPSA